MNNLFKVCLTLSIFFTCFVALAEKKFIVTIHIPSQFDLGKLNVFYDNGKETVQLDTVLNNSRMTISEVFYSEYASITMNYPREDGSLPYYYKGYFVSDKPATIIFHPTSAANPFEISSSTNASVFDDLGANKLNVFVKKEETDFWDFYNTNVDKLATNDSLATILSKKMDNLLNKKAEFVKQNGDSYYSFWLFRREITYNKSISKDSLFAIFESVFPDKFKKSLEGDEIRKIIRGSSLLKNEIAPEFKTNDIHGNAISLERFRDKHILLNFWASWCSPCIKELPEINEIRSHFPKEKLEIVFISLDQDSIAFGKAIEKNRIEWGHHILANEDLVRTFGATSVPKVYLIDPKGIIIYSRDEEKDYQLTALHDLLSRKLLP